MCELTPDCYSAWYQTAETADRVAVIHFPEMMSDWEEFHDGGVEDADTCWIVAVSVLHLLGDFVRYVHLAAMHPAITVTQWRHASRRGQANNCPCKF